MAEARGVEAAPTHQDSEDSLAAAAARSRWAQLLARIYEASPLRCPECGSHMRILAFLTDPDPTDDLNHTPAFDPADPEPVPEFDLDQICGA